jgi:hypothetical protein
MICRNESATLLFGLLCARIGPSLFAICSVAVGARLDITPFLRELFANRISAFFAIDVTVSAIVLLWFIQNEGKRLRVGLLCLRTVGTLIVGVSFWFAAFSFSKRGNVGPNNCSSLTDSRRDDAK